MKELTKEKDELQSKIYKMNHTLQQEEKIKDTIRERNKQIQEEINQQLKAKFGCETTIMKQTEELRKLEDGYKKDTGEVAIFR